MADHGAPNAGAANDVGWDSAAASADGPDADAGPAHRPGAPRVPTAASLQSQASFHGMRQLLTSRARTVSSRADTAHVLEVAGLRQHVPSTPPRAESLSHLLARRERRAAWAGRGLSLTACWSTALYPLRASVRVLCVPVPWGCCVDSGSGWRWHSLERAWMRTS